MDTARRRRLVSSPTRLRRLAVSAVALLVVGVVPSPVLAAPFRDLSCADDGLPAIDDVSSAAIALPFDVNFSGAEFDEVFVNSNGTVSAFRAVADFEPYDLRDVTVPLFAPFWSDIDLTKGGSITWGHGEVDGEKAFCVDFRDVAGFGLSPGRTNSFQMIMIDRQGSDPHLELEFRYERIMWDRGALNQASAYAGFTNGDGGRAVQFGGSGLSGSFVDGAAHALATTSIGSDVPGELVFALRSSGEIHLTGTVTRAADGSVVAGATVIACPTNQVAACRHTVSDAEGRYSLLGLDGSVDVRASGIDGLVPATARIDLGGDAELALEMRSLAPPPADIELSPIRPGHGVTPMVLYSDDIDVVVAGCVGGIGSFVVVAEDGTIRAGALRELEPGRHHGTIRALFAAGRATVAIDVHCGDPAVERHDRFDIFIDPSGIVRTIEDRRPVPGATVTLLRADHIDGPFRPVTDPAMFDPDISPTNPMVTDVDATFRWDLAPGWYQVEADSPQCDRAVRSSSFRAPDQPLGLVIELPCDGPPVGPATCRGLVATIEGTGLILGTPGDDVIVGSDANDRIEGGDGDDVICGGGGNDIIDGGDGADLIEGGDGRDIADYSRSDVGVAVSIGGGDADGRPGEGDDVGADIEVVLGSTHDDVLLGSPGPDTLRGLQGNDIIRGRGGDDVLYGGAEVDVLVGGDGDDTLSGGHGTDRCRGDDGVDSSDTCELVRSVEP